MHKSTPTALLASLMAGGLLLAGCGGSGSATTGGSHASSAAASAGKSSAATGGSHASAPAASSGKSSAGSSSGSSAYGSGASSSAGASKTSGGSGAPSSGVKVGTSASVSVTTTPVSPFQKKYLSVDSASKTVTWTLDGGAMGGSSPFAYDGVSDGKMVLTVPKGWHVKVDFKNVGKLSHSAVVVSQKNNKTPAFPGATTPHANSGSPPGSTYSYTFTPTATGTDYVVCVVPGHLQGGMWAVIKVVASGQPTLKG